MDSSIQIIAELRKLLPAQFLRAITQGIVSCYKQAHIKSCTEVDPAFVKRDRSARRVSLIDTQLKELACQHFNIKGSAQSTSNQSHSFTELIVEERLILTISATTKERELPRNAKYRFLRATNNPSYVQLQTGLVYPNTLTNHAEQNLIEVDFKNKSYNQNKKFLYGIIVHGPRNKESPEYIKIGIPDRDCRFYTVTMDLFGEYISLQDLETGFEAEDSQIKPIEPPSARLRDSFEEYIEDQDEIAGEGEADGDNQSDEES